MQKKIHHLWKTRKKEIIIVKKDGRREKFSREKLKNGIIRACEKRPVSIEKIEKILNEVEEKLDTKGKEIKSERIGKLVMSRLKKLDKVSYIRFASVYRDFQDISDFKKAVSEVWKKGSKIFKKRRDKKWQQKI